MTGMLADAPCVWQVFDLPFQRLVRENRTSSHDRNGAAEQVLTPPPTQASSDSLVLLYGGDVIPMDRERVLARHSVLIRRGRIVEVTPARQSARQPMRRSSMCAASMCCPA
jgi:hypothetical protein